MIDLLSPLKATLSVPVSIILTSQFHLTGLKKIQCTVNSIGEVRPLSV